MTLQKNIAALMQTNPGCAAALQKQLASSDLPKLSVVASGGRYEATLPDGKRVPLARPEGSVSVDREAGLRLVLGFGDGAMVGALLNFEGANEVLVYEPQPALLLALLYAGDFSAILGHP